MSLSPHDRPQPATLPRGLEHSSPPPGLRLLPAPSCEPPYDDERPGGRPLPLRAEGTRIAPLRLVPPLVELPPSGSSGLPAARPFAQALVQRLLEVRAGLRPVTQLQPDTTAEVYEALERSLADRARPSGTGPGPRAIRSLHVQEQSDAVAEVTATVRRGTRYACVAFRIEGVGGRWRCTQLLAT